MSVRLKTVIQKYFQVFYRKYYYRKEKQVVRKWGFHGLRFIFYLKATWKVFEIPGQRSVDLVYIPEMKSNNNIKVH